MHWKMKAMMQNAIALLPSNISYATYYWIQRRFGGWRNPDPINRLSASAELWRRIRSTGRNPVHGVFLEVGTGHVPLVPLGYWLMGAQRTFTIDLNPYLNDELIEETLLFIAANPARVEAAFGEFLDKARFAVLIEYARNREHTTRAFLDLCGITYMAPADATDTSLPPESIDFHTSYTVLEHIPPGVLGGILREGSRLLRDSGLFVHHVDYTDHFSHSDSRISAINFLRYSDAQWRLYAGNRYMYMNRLRHDEMVEIFTAGQLRLVDVDVRIDSRSRQLLETGRLRVHEDFRAKSFDALSTAASWIIANKAT